MEVKVNALVNTRKKHSDIGWLFRGKNVSCRSRPLRLGKNSSHSATIYRGTWKGLSPSEHKAAIKQVKRTDCIEHWEIVVDWHQNGSLNHTNVLKVFGFEDDLDWRYFALERFDATLEQFCTGQYTGPMPYDNQVLYQISKGLIYLHRKGLAHGNLTPKTILIAKSEPVKMKISDFGLCRQVIIDDSKKTVQQLTDIDHLEQNDNKAFDEISESNSAATCSDDQEELSHPKFWKRPKIMRSLSRSVSRSGSRRSIKSKVIPINEDNSYSIPGATVEGDIFAAGCLFFYFLKRMHPFGDARSILTNTQEWNPVNLKELEEHHFAYEPIVNLIGPNSPEDSNQLLIDAAFKFQVGAFGVAWRMKLKK